MAPAQATTDRFPLADADKCVQCGLCLPHCPTYRKIADENESPRGRIALMRAMVRRDLPLTSKLASHLDRCLACRNCEAACPAQVPYGRLIDAARAFVTVNRRESWGRRMLWRWAVNGLLVHPGRLAGLGRLLRGYQLSGVQAIARGSGLLRSLGLAAVEAQLPPIPKLKRYATDYPVKDAARGEVALFLGCITRVLDQPAIDAAIRILNKVGYRVRVAPEQNCCGAVHQHAGDTAGARRLITQNLHAFASTGAAPVITLASGCGAMLKEYGQHASTQQASDFGARVYDLVAYLEDHHAALFDNSSSSTDRIAVHDPCSLRTVMQSAHKTHRLLSRVSNTTVDTLSSNAACCGAAGIYFLTQTGLSEQLRDDTLQAIQDSGCRTVVTSNIGCALHLAAGLMSNRLDVEVVHPAILIDRILRR